MRDVRDEYIRLLPSGCGEKDWKLKEIEIMPGRLPDMVVALYYPDEDKYVGVMTRRREAVPGLLVFEGIVQLTLYQCAGSKHVKAVPKILNLEEARVVVRSRGNMQSIILFRPPGSFTVEYVM
jgi:hypothetical protein